MPLHFARAIEPATFVQAEHGRDAGWAWLTQLMFDDTDNLPPFEATYGVFGSFDRMIRDQAARITPRAASTTWMLVERCPGRVAVLEDLTERDARTRARRTNGDETEWEGRVVDLMDPRIPVAETRDQYLVRIETLATALQMLAAGTEWEYAAAVCGLRFEAP
jgi:hypothetical protein